MLNIQLAPTQCQPCIKCHAVVVPRVHNSCASQKLYNNNATTTLPAGNYSSQLGTTRTLPAVGGARRQIRLAQQSFVNWRFGFWHVYNITAQIQDVDAVVFLGVSTATIRVLLRLNKPW